MAAISDQDKDVIRRATFGAIALVSKADPGFFATFKESMAGSKALAAAPENIRELLKGGLIAPPSGGEGGVEQAILGDIRAAKAALADDPAALQGWTGVVESAMQQVAEASKGVAPAEQAMIDKIRAALAEPAGPATGGGVPGPSDSPLTPQDS